MGEAMRGNFRLEQDKTFLKILKDEYPKKQHFFIAETLFHYSQQKI